MCIEEILLTLYIILIIVQGNTKEVSRNQIFSAIRLIKLKQDLLLKFLKIQLKILKRLKTFSDSLSFKKFLQKL